MIENIKFFNLTYNKKDINFFLKKSKDVLDRGFISESFYTKLFEEKISKKFKFLNSIFVGSGTDALEIAFKLTDPKKKIILQANNFFAAHVALEQSNKKALYCDLELASLGIDPDSLESILKKNKDIDSICLVHTGGIISDNIEDICYLAKKYNCVLIEDAAHAHGSKKNGIYAGNFGDISCFSFFPTKVMTTGEGGLINLKRKKDFYKARSLKNFGRNLKDEWIREINGSNCKVTEFQSILGLLELKRFNQRIYKRKVLFDRYKKNLSNSNFKIYDSNQDQNSFYKIILEHKNFSYNQLIKLFKKKKIPTSGRVWPYPLNNQKFKPKIKYLKKNLINTEYFVKNHFCLPLYPELTIKEVDTICMELLHVK